MRSLLQSLIVLVTAAPLVQAATLKMPSAPVLDVSGAAALTTPAVLVVSDELRDTSYVVRTSPFDKIRYPVGEYTVALLERNLGRAFASWRAAPQADAIPESTLQLTLTIERFEAVIAHPAYKPYTADVVYRLTVRDPAGETVFTQTAAGSAQTSKGMLSGFGAKQLAAEAAARAMNDAMTQLLAGLLEADELRPAGGPSAADDRGTADASGSTS